MPNKQRIGVILGAQRSGTTAIGRMLSTHENTYYTGEIFHHARGPHDDPNYRRFMADPDFNFFSFKETLLRRFPALCYPSEQNQMAIWTEYLYTIRTHQLANTIIFDIKYNSLHHLNPIWQETFHFPYLLNLLRRDAAPILHVVRTDLFRQAVSEQRAKMTGTWHRQTKEVSASEAPLALDPAGLKHIMFRNSRMRKHITDLLRLYPHYAEITYEEAFLGAGLSDAAAARIAALFGLEPPQFGAADLVQLSQAPLRTAISNIDEILDFFAGSPYEGMVAAAIKS